MSDLKIKKTPIVIGGREFNICFNLNVIDEIETEYGGIADMARAITKPKNIKKVLFILISDDIETRIENGEMCECVTEKWIGKNITPAIAEKLMLVILKAFREALPGNDGEEDFENPKQKAEQ